MIVLIKYITMSFLTGIHMYSHICREVLHQRITGNSTPYKTE